MATQTKQTQPRRRRAKPKPPEAEAEQQAAAAVPAGSPTTADAGPGSLDNPVDPRLPVEGESTAPAEPAPPAPAETAKARRDYDVRLDQPHAELRLRLRHARGCPQSGELDRVEAYPAQVPDRQGGGQVIIVRCQECGAHAREDELD